MDILIDLDGTVHDPAPGIVGSVQYALRELGLPVPSTPDLHWVIGPPLRVVFPQIGVKADDVERAVVPVARLRRPQRAAQYHQLLVDRVPVRALPEPSGDVSLDVLTLD